MSKNCTNVMIGMLGIAILVLLLVDFPSLLGGVQEGFFGDKNDNKDKDSGGGFFGNKDDNKDDSGGGFFGNKDDNKDKDSGGGFFGGSSSKSKKNPHMRSIEDVQSTFEDLFSEKSMTNLLEASNSSAAKGVLGMFEEAIGAQLRTQIAGQSNFEITPQITQLKNQLEIINLAISSGGGGLGSGSSGMGSFGGSSKKSSSDEKSGWF